MRYFVVSACLLAVSVCAAAQSSPSMEEGRRGDIAVFRREFFARDSSYSPAHHEEAVQRLSRLEARAGSMTAAQFELELARIVALADNGHSNSPAALRSLRAAGPTQGPWP